MTKQRGFTLAEMIVALAVSALLVTLAYGALRIGVRSWEAAQTGVDRLDTLRVGWQAVHDTLVASVATRDPEATGPGILFNGEPDNLIFTANMPSYLGLGGLYRVELFRDDRLENTPFKLRRTLYSAYQQNPRDAEVQQADLADHVAQLSFRYFGITDQGGAPAWQDSWSEMPSLPVLVRIEVILENGEHWPALVAKLHQASRLREINLEDTFESGVLPALPGSGL